MQPSPSNPSRPTHPDLAEELAPADARRDELLPEERDDAEERRDDETAELDGVPPELVDEASAERAWDDCWLQLAGVTHAPAWQTCWQGVEFPQAAPLDRLCTSHAPV